MAADLHTHSRCSDGTDAPSEVVAAAVAAGLTAVALTDHDTFAGWDEAQRAADAAGIELVPGIEMSCHDRGISLHLLAYWPDRDDAALSSEVAAVRDDRLPRAARTVDLLAADGYAVTLEQVLEAAAGAPSVGRPHVAQVLVDTGDAASIDDAFDRFLGKGRPYHVAHHTLEADVAVGLVRAAGGVPVMAHPFAALRGPVVADEAVERLAAAGLAALEAHHPDHTPEQREHAERLATRLGLLVTGSSDYHGARKGWRVGERTTPDEVVAALRAQARARSG